MKLKKATNMIKSPTRYSKDFQHRDFGIVNWFRSQGIYDTTIQSDIINHYLIDNNFVEPKGGKKAVRNSRTAFIQNRFVAFCNFALKYKKENLL
jgi:hypothetical protein